MTDDDLKAQSTAVFHPDYFSTEFRCSLQGILPENFVIITAYATTGESWTESQNKIADEALKDLLVSQGFNPIRITGYSPKSTHAEPGWAVALDWQTACDIGLKFKQDAIFVVEQQQLYLSKCDKNRQLISVGNFIVHRARTCHR